MSWINPLHLLHDGVSMAVNKFARGAKPTPRHKLLASTPFRALPGAPAQFAVIPKQLSMWGNSQYGDCVSAEEAFAKAAWSVMCNLPETFIAEQSVIQWASQHGFLNGANLTDVMDAMAQSGMPAGGNIYTDGAYRGVDYSNESVLQAAIFAGPVKIGIDADALPDGAGNSNGWWSNQTGSFNNEDHCVGLCGYGSASFLFAQLGLTVPSGLDPNTMGYLLFTWNTIGFVTHGWLMSTCQEAWVRNPTTPGQGPVPDPGPGPGPGPGPSPGPGPVQIGVTMVPAGPDQAFSIPGSLLHPGYSFTVKGYPGGTFPTTTTPSDLTADAVQSMLTAAGITPASVGNLTPAQWQMIIAIILQLLPILFPPTPPSGSVAARAGKLTPAQWAAIIQLVLTLLPIFLGG